MRTPERPTRAQRRGIEIASKAWDTAIAVPRTGPLASRALRAWTVWGLSRDTALRDDLGLRIQDLRLESPDLVGEGGVVELEDNLALLDHGAVDTIIDRREMRDRVSNMLGLLMGDKVA